MTKKPEATIKSYFELFWREEDDLVYDDEKTLNPFTGYTQDFHANGQLWFEGNYKNGKQEGLHQSFHENGQLQQKGNYKEGKQDGLWEYFDEDGNLLTTGEYKDGELVE